MSNRSGRSLVVIILIVIALIALLATTCTHRFLSPKTTKSEDPTKAVASPTTKAPAPTAGPEVLTPATLQAPPTLVAGAPFKVHVVGPKNRGDFITIVRSDARPGDTGDYAETTEAAAVEMNAPLNAGEYELRYVTARSKTILGRTPLSVQAPTASVTGPETAVLGTTVSVSWTGPNNPNDYITVVPQQAPDGRYGNYTLTAKGSPLTVTVPVDAGDAELRYMTGQGAKVLARRAIKIIAPEVSLSAPDQVEAGSTFEVKWTGPNNPGDYVTVVPKDFPDGRYANYTETKTGSVLKVLALIAPGEAELRYMTGTGARVLTRRPIMIKGAQVSLEAAPEVTAGAAVKITWKGPANHGDYITIVPQSLPDGQYARYADTNKGSPLTVEAPLEPGAAEIRYMSGQGAKVLARRSITTVAPQITLKGPPQAPANSKVSIEWTGPNNPGDYLTVVLASAKDGVTQHTALTARGTPATVGTPRESGPGEIRYMSGQGNRVLARSSIELTDSK